MKKFLEKYKKNIIFFCPSIEEGGVEKNLINIVNAIGNDFNVSVITANNDKKKKFNKNIKFISPNSNYFNKKSRILKSLVSSFLFFKNYHSKSTVISFQSNIIAIVLSKLTFNKVIIRSNSSPNIYAKNFFKRILFRIFFRFADKIIVNSKEFKKEFYRFFKLKSYIIYNSIESSKYLKYKSNKKVNFGFFDNAKKTLKILSIGRLVYQKDHMTILKAIKEIKDKRKVKLCIIGKGNQKKRLMKFIKFNKLNKVVKIIEYKNNVYPYLLKANLFILSSLYEGLPNTLLEAKSFNIPIISSDCRTGPKEILENYKNGKLFSIKNFKELSRLILLSKQSNKKKFIYDKRFDFNKNIQIYKNLLNSV